MDRKLSLIAALSLIACPALHAGPKEQILRALVGGSFAFLTYGVYELATEPKGKTDLNELQKLPESVEKYLLNDLRKRGALGEADTQEFRVLKDNTQDFHTNGNVICIPPGFIEGIESLLKEGKDPLQECLADFNGIVHERGHAFYGDNMRSAKNPALAQAAMWTAWGIFAGSLAAATLYDPTILKTLGALLGEFVIFDATFHIGLAIKNRESRKKEVRADQFAIDHTSDWQELESVAQFYDKLAAQEDRKPDDSHPLPADRAKMFKAAAEKLKQKTQNSFTH